MRSKTHSANPKPVKRRSLSGIVTFISVASGMFSLILFVTWIGSSVSKNFETIFMDEVTDRVEILERRVNSDVDRLETSFLQIAQDSHFRTLLSEGNRAGLLSYLFEQNQKSTISPFSLIYVNRGDQIALAQTSMIGSRSAQQLFFDQIEQQPSSSLVTVRSLGLEGQKRLFLLFSTIITDSRTLEPIGELRAAMPLLSHSEMISQAMKDTNVACLYFIYNGKKYRSFGDDNCVAGANRYLLDETDSVFQSNEGSQNQEFVYSNTSLVDSFADDGLNVVLGKQTRTLSMLRQQIKNFGFALLAGLLLMAGITFVLTRFVLRHEMTRLLSYVASSSDKDHVEPPLLYVNEFQKIAGEFTQTRDRLIEKERERQRADKNIEDLNRELQHAHSQKMESLGVLTSGVAHDFNNILAIISASLEQMAGESAQSQEMKVASHAVERASLLVRQLLTYAKQDDGQTAAIDQGKELDSLLTILMPTFGPRYDLQVVRHTEDWITADPNLFDATLMNLAINARDAMPDGGEIKIESRKATEADLIQGELGCDEEMIAISVSDTGPGMPQEVAKRVFEPFFTTKPVGKGTGLGLSMAFGFAQSAGGSIFIDQNYKNGCRVVMLLPATNPPSVAKQKAPASLPGSFGGQRILVVDDEKALGEMTARFLRSKKADVTLVFCVEEAFRVLEEEAPFDVVLSDLNIPDGNGHEVIGKAANKSAGNTAYFLMSGNFEKSDTFRTEDNILIHRFPKPFRLMDLVDFMISRIQFGINEVPSLQKNEHLNALVG